MWLTGFVGIIPFALSPSKGLDANRWFDPVLSIGEGLTANGVQAGCQRCRFNAVPGMEYLRLKSVILRSEATKNLVGVPPWRPGPTTPDPSLPSG